MEKKKETFIKGKPRKEYMRDYMREYYQRPEVKKKRILRSQQCHAEKVKEELEERQKCSSTETDIKIIDMTRLDSKNRVVLGRNTCNILGVLVSDEIAVIKDGKHVKLVKMADIKIVYR